MSGRQRQAIVVLGMHRSGTSALARVVTLLGAAGPAHLLEPRVDNPTGFWESLPIANTNNVLLTAGGATPFDCLTFAAGSIDGTTLVDILESVLQMEFGDADLFMMKDPRLCLTLSSWLPTFASMRIRLSALLVLRNPVEVAHSLLLREALTAEVSALHWLRYNLDAERQTRGFSRSILFYDQLLRDWRHCMERAGREADVAWPNSSDTIAAQVDRFLRADLRHHRASLERLPSVANHIWDWAVEVYEALRQVEQTGWDVRQLNRLDRVREEFDEWCRRGSASTEGLR